MDFSWSQRFLDDFQLQYNVGLTLESERSLLGSPWSLAWRLIADFILCHAFFGPFLIAYWRGTWDYAIVYSEDIFGVKLNF